MSKYIDDILRVLDHAHRDLEPIKGDRGFGAPVAGEIRSIDAKAREITTVVSSNSVDRYGEIVEPKAFAKWLDNFYRNPVLAANHLYVGENGEPMSIGTWRDISTKGDKVIGVAKFMEGDELAEKWWKRYAAGVARAFSIGFLAHAWDMQQREIEGERRMVRVFTEIELIEISAVTIPANRDAVRAASADGNRCTPKDPSDLDQRLAQIEEQLTQLTSTEPDNPIFAVLQMFAERQADGVGAERYFAGEHSTGKSPAPSSFKGQDQFINEMRDLLR